LRIAVAPLQRWHVVGVVRGIHDHADGRLLLIAGTGDPVGSFLRGSQSGQQHRRENGDDGDDHQQLDEG